MQITLGQQYNVGEKLTVILYILLSSMRLVRSAMGEYLVLVFGSAGYRIRPLRKGTYGIFLIGQSAPFLIHGSPN